MASRINRTVLMSGADFMADTSAINPYMVKGAPIDIERAKQEHANIQAALRAAGVEIIKVAPPRGCQDGVYTANWALVRGNTAVLSTLPNARKGEEPYAAQVLSDLGKTVTKVPDDLHFSGQGDALACGNYLFAGSGYRTDRAAHQFIADTLKYEVISLQTIPRRSLFGLGKPTINRDSGWPDSFFYDIDLAISVLTPSLIAWCPKAFTTASRAKIRALKDIDKIEVSFKEARQAFACNLVSTGETVVMSATAPKLQAAIRAKGLKVVTPQITELSKGGGYIRCTSLTLD